MAFFNVEPLSANIASLAADGSGFNIGVQKNFTSLILTVDYTKGTETQVSATFSVILPAANKSKLFGIVSATNPVSPFTVTLTASGKYVIPVPLPSNTASVYMNVAVSGTSNSTSSLTIGVASNSGYITFTGAGNNAYNLVD